MTALVQVPKIMGIVNVTPDSFSDGGQFFAPEECQKKIDRLVEEGADIIEFGAESTRPGSTYVDADEEWNRLSKIFEFIQRNKIPVEVSVDTRKPAIMRRAAEYGANYINNVEGLVEPFTLNYLASKKLKYIAMHMHRTPVDMQTQPLIHGQALDAVKKSFEHYQRELIAAGFDNSQIYLDPGIGFGKSDAANLELLSSARALADSAQIAIGVSRKGFLSRLFGAENLDARDACSKAIETWMLMSGCEIIRTHEVQKISAIKSMLIQIKAGY